MSGGSFARDVLAEVLDFGERMVAVETQVKRFISDIESEKGTRSRAADRLDKKIDDVVATVERKLDAAALAREQQFEKVGTRLAKHDRVVWTAVGVLATLQLLLSLAPLALKLLGAP